MLSIHIILFIHSVLSFLAHAARHSAARFRHLHFSMAWACLLCLCVLLSPCPPRAEAIPGLGKEITTLVRETLETVSRKFGIALTQKSGKNFAEEGAEFLAKHGDDGARALKAVGPEIMAKASRHGDELVTICARYEDDAARFLAHNADEAIAVWNRYGSRGTDILVKHPGTGKIALETWGKEGVELAEKLSTQQLNKVLVMSKKLPAGEGSGLAREVASRGDNFLNYLWQHKGKLAAAGGLYALVHEYETVHTETDSSGNSTKVIMHESILKRGLLSTLDALLNNYPWIVMVGGCFLLYGLWIVIGLLKSSVETANAVLQTWKEKFQRGPR